MDVRYPVSDVMSVCPGVEKGLPFQADVEMMHVTKRSPVSVGVRSEAFSTFPKHACVRVYVGPRCLVVVSDVERRTRQWLPLDVIYSPVPRVSSRILAYLDEALRIDPMGCPRAFQAARIVDHDTSRVVQARSYRQIFCRCVSCRRVARQVDGFANTSIGEGPERIMFAKPLSRKEGVRDVSGSDRIGCFSLA